jgi:hypothetical protein
MKGTVNSGAFFKLEENKKANERCQKGLNEKRKN